MENPGYSLADIKAVTEDNDASGCMGGNWMWMIVLFLLFNRGFGYGYGFDGAAANGALTRAELYDGLNYNQIENGIRGVQNGLCDGFYSQNTTMLQGFNGIQNQLCQDFSAVNAQIAENRFAAQQCCCETNRNIDAVRSENYKNTCEITNAIHSEGEQTRALINSNTMQTLRDKLADKDRELQTANFQLSQQAQSSNIINTLRPFPQPAYITCSPYTSATPAYANCGCGCGCA